MHLLVLCGLCLASCSDEKPCLSYGAFASGNQTSFKIFAPRAEQVQLVIFKTPDDSSGREYSMSRDSLGDWTLTLNNLGAGTLYGYRLEGQAPGMDPAIIIADPFSVAAVTQNTYRHVAKSLIIDDRFDWGDDTWISVPPRDLIIYELHVRDMTAHPTSGAQRKGTYLGLVEPDQRGGIAHLIQLGINAVQLLPAQDFANVEVPYHDKTTPVYNTWNPYARNHWGYMTTFFFAPESYYATDGTRSPDAWNGTDGRAVREFKEMVKAFHRQGIAVIMDVVYNHVSQYDYQPLKYIDREVYFRLDENGNYIAQSGCGNDCRTEHPALRRLILESVKYWMTEYHIDGFRFDLGNLIDRETRQAISRELRAINPGVIILAEPWGGGYDPTGFSDQDWASFNDQFRNGVKGQNPQDGLGFIFGQWQDTNDQASLRRYVMGSRREHGGQYRQVAHSVNYLESHDDHTLGDFIRLASRQVGEHDLIRDRQANAAVAGRQLALNKLGALFLFTSQGITFMHQGQEWGRSKVIAPTPAPDERVGQIDHNSYNKDNETNWLNWNEKEANRDLVEYYRGLIALRKTYPAFRRSEPDQFEFLDVGPQVALAYQLNGGFLVALNGDPHKELNLELPPGDWEILVDHLSINRDGGEVKSGSLKILPTSGMVLKRI